MNNNNTFFYHINAGALAHIYVAGCIRPTFLIERRELDVQSHYPHFLLLSTKKWANQNDCSVEVILRSEEHQRLIYLSDEYYLFDTILPVSRVVKIHFSDTDKANTVLWNIRNGAAFLPERLIEYSSRNQKEIVKKKPLKSNFTNANIEEVEKYFKRFNRLLGGVAFLRTALSDYSDSQINYPENYIATVSFFNSFLRKEFDAVDCVKNFNLHTYFQNREDALKYLSKDINDQIIYEVSKSENIIPLKRLGVYDLDNIPPSSLTFLLCLLNVYGKNKTKSIEDFINEVLINRTNRREEVALLMGIYSGYEALRNSYKISDKRINVKFDFESKLDYYIVESIYEFLFDQSLVSGRFDYIDSMHIESKKANVNEDYFSYMVLGSNIVTKKKEYSNQFKKLIKNIVGELSNLLNNKFFIINEEKLIEDLIICNKEIFNDIINSVKSERTASTQTVVSKHMALPDALIDYNLREENAITPNIQKAHIQAKSLQIEKELFEVEQKPVAFSRDLIINASGLKMLREIAKNNKISVPKSISRKEDIVNYLLSKL